MVEAAIDSHRKLILLLIVMVLGLTLSCGKPIWPKDQQQRLLRREFYKCALWNSRTSFEDLSNHLHVAHARGDWLIQEEMPTWRSLILDLYADPTLAEEEPYIYASALLRKNLKSHIRIKFISSIYLSYLKPDTAEARCIEEYANKQTDEERKGTLLYIAQKIRERFYVMQYCIMKDRGLAVVVPDVLFLESPPKADSYIPIFIDSDTILTIDDHLIPVEEVPGVIDEKTKYGGDHKCCIMLLANQDVTWELIWRILEPLMELSRRNAGNLEFFFKTDEYHPRTASEPNKLGLSFQLKNSPLKSIDADIHVDAEGYLLIDGKKQRFSDLEELPPNKNIRFAFSKQAKLKYILRVLSLIKKSCPNAYYYVVE